ncbi:MAG: peptidylprolyl isomerase [SAR324 cluster bacterium]|nr:peptidylprolyl isomerase [SAR324 cluster bacterium]MBL7034534.1 peptidylprolyl isomerase [SAR324 cluster bacterium]
MRFNYYPAIISIIFVFGIGFFANILLAEVLVIDRIYLIVNSQMLTRSEAQDVSAALKAQNSSAKQTQQEHDKKLLMNLVQEMLLLDRASALKIIAGTKEIESRLDQLARDQPQLLEVYAEDDLKEQLAREFKKHHVISREVDSKIRVESQEIKLFCEKQLRKERKVGLAQILLQGSTEEVQEQVTTIRGAFESGASFEDLAKLHSADASAKRTGGKLGIFKPEDLLAEIGEVTKSLLPGEISKLVKTTIGHHLLYIYQEVFPQGLTCSELSADQKVKYSNALSSQKREELLGTYMDELYACANIEIKDPESSGLPDSLALPVIEQGDINCQARRVMVIPQKKKKKKKKVRK